MTPKTPPLKTAVQVVESIPAEPPKPVEPEPEIQPSKERLEAFRTCSGTHPPEAEAAARREARAKYQRNRATAPSKADEIRDLAKQGDALHAQAATLNQETARASGEQETREVRAAQLRRDIDGLRKQLAAAQSELDDPAKALALTDERVIVLTNQTRHLPSRIQKLEQELAGLETKLADGYRTSGVERDLLLAYMRRNAEPLPGRSYAQAPEILGLFNAGWLPSPEAKSVE